MRAVHFRQGGTGSLPATPKYDQLAGPRRAAAQEVAGLDRQQAAPPTAHRAPAPAGTVWLAAARAACRRAMSMPRSRSRARIEPDVHRAAGRAGRSWRLRARRRRALSSASRAGDALEVRRRSCPRASISVTASTGTSSMPFGLTTGGSTPGALAGSQSWLAKSPSSCQAQPEGVRCGARAVADLELATRHHRHAGARDRIGSSMPWRSARAPAFGGPRGHHGLHDPRWRQPGRRSASLADGDALDPRLCLASAA